MYHIIPNIDNPKIKDIIAFVLFSSFLIRELIENTTPKTAKTGASKRIILSINPQPEPSANILFKSIEANKKVLVILELKAAETNLTTISIIN